ncbi:MAG: lasso peptide biosynthesis B2 protein [Acidobacteriota bacterium]
MRSRLETALTMSRRQWAVLIRAWFVLTVISISLRCVPLPTLRNFLRRCSPLEGSPAMSGAEVRRLVTRAGRLHPARVVCLQRSLCLEYLLRRQGTLADFRLGVRRSGDSIEAHAWVELNGEPLGEQSAPSSFRCLEMAH